MPTKSDKAFLTISEVSADVGVPQHILRYWETRFPQLKPLQRAGNRRYYRPEDVALVRRIDGLLNRDGYTVRGVQQLLAEGTAAPAVEPPKPAATAPAGVPVEALTQLRGLLIAALEADRERG